MLFISFPHPLLCLREYQMLEDDLFELLNEIQQQSKKTDLAQHQQSIVLEDLAQKILTDSKKPNTGKRQAIYTIEAGLIFSAFYTLLSNIQMGLYIIAFTTFLFFMLPAFLFSKYIIKPK